MSLADELRGLVREFYLDGTQLGLRLEGLVPRVEALERGASPVSDCEPESEEDR